MRSEAMHNLSRTITSVEAGRAGLLICGDEIIIRDLDIIESLELYHPRNRDAYNLRRDVIYAKEMRELDRLMNPEPNTHPNVEKERKKLKAQGKNYYAQRFGGK